jgi:hypothetical protein
MTGFIITLTLLMSLRYSYSILAELTIFRQKAAEAEGSLAREKPAD